MVAMALAFAPAAVGCDIPVYEYALENWVPDSYHIYVFAESGLDTEDAAAVDRLREAAHGEQRANLKLIEVALQDPMPALADALWKEHAPSDTHAAPWVVLRNPLPLPPRAAVWTGALAEAAGAGILESDARRTVARTLKAGALAVWLLLTSGDAEKDQRAMTTLQGALKTAEEQTAGELGEAQRAGAPAISDCVLRVDRADEAEAFLVDSLLATEADLRNYDEPIVFPVYGRGRVLYALVGKGINPATIIDTALFLTGECSCIVKDDNPGVDLLINADWGEPGGKPEATGYGEIALPHID
ncbi:MAG: hypothetical protein ACLFTT_08720 [Candidatus Hydrogenedentota bacterium]